MFKKTKINKKRVGVGPKF